MKLEPNGSLETAKQKMSNRQMAVIALMTALMCILGPMSIPIGAIPISFTNLVIYITAYLLGTKFGAISYCIYLLIGMVGIPVFSGFSGGPAKLAGPTGGYLIGFLFIAIISGIFIQKGHGKNAISILGMILGTLVAYIFGTIWFVIQAECTVMYALTVCVFPFLIADGIKIIVASKVGPLIQNTLHKAHLLDT